MKKKVSALNFVVMLMFVFSGLCVGGTNVILYDRDGDIYFANTNDLFEIQLTTTTGTPSDFGASISPDGTTIAFSRDYDLYLIDYDGSNQRLLVSKGDVGGNLVHFSDWTLDGEWVYFNALSGASSGGLYKVRPDGTGLTTVKSGYISSQFRIRGGKVIFTQRCTSLSYSQNLRIMDLDGNNEEFVTACSTSEGTAVFGSCWSPDGQRFAYNYGHQHIYVADYPAPYNPIEVKTLGSWKSHSLGWLNNDTLIWIDGYHAGPMHTINVDTLVETPLGIDGHHPYVGQICEPACEEDIEDSDSYEWQFPSDTAGTLTDPDNAFDGNWDTYAEIRSNGNGIYAMVADAVETWSVPVGADLEFNCKIESTSVFQHGIWIKFWNHSTGQWDDQVIYGHNMSYTHPLDGLAEEKIPIPAMYVDNFGTFKSKVMFFNKHSTGSWSRLYETSITVICEPEPPCPLDWSRIADLPGDQHGACGAVIDGLVYLVGGINPSGPVYNKMRIYDPTTDSWSDGVSMSTPRVNANSGVIEGSNGPELYVVGGYSGSAGLSTVERYIVSQGIWQTVASLSEPRGNAIMTAVVNNNLYAIGGHYNWDQRYATNEMYDRQSNVWIEKAPITKDGQPFPLAMGMPAVWDNKIFIFGGYPGYGPITTTLIYDTLSDTWSEGAEMPLGRTGHRAVTFGDYIYLIGWAADSKIIDVYDPVTDSWLTTDDYPGNNTWSPVITQSDNLVYALGENWDNPTGMLECWVGRICEPASIQVAIDIKPGSCPNPVNVKSKGVVAVAILGTETFDVDEIDIASIRLEGVAPIRSNYEDVGTAVVDGEECECTTEGADGYMDLTLKFDTQSIVAAIGEVNHGDELRLALSGVLLEEFGGTPIEGVDCIVIRGKHKPLNAADLNKDGVVNVVDLAIMSHNWLQSNIVE